MAIDKRFIKYLPGTIGVVLILVISGVVLFTVRGWIMDKPDTRSKKVIQQITILQPPPPKLEKPPPPPEMERTEMDLAEPDQVMDDDMPDVADDQALGDLGLDAEGVGGSDGFGLVGRKGGRGLMDGGPFGFYAGLLKEELHKSLYEHEEIRKETYSITVKVWINKRGKVTKVKMLDATGNKKIDKAIMLALNSAGSLSEAPPEQMPQPVMLRITSRTP